MLILTIISNHKKKEPLYMEHADFRKLAVRDMEGKLVKCGLNLGSISHSFPHPRVRKHPEASSKFQAA